MKLSSFKSAVALAAGFALAGGAAQAGDKISAGKLAKDAKDFYGKTVTVEAEVEDVLGSNMFTLDEDALLGGADVLVLVPSGVTGSLTRDQKVVVTGEVRRYVQTELDRDYDWFDDGKLVDVKTKVDWDTRPVLVARSIKTTTGVSLMGGAVQTSSADTDTMMHASHGTAVLATPISAGKLARDAQAYYGQTISVKAEVEDVLGPNMFTLDEDSLLAGSDVLVLVPRGLAGNLTHDQKVVVTGKVRQFVETELDRDYDWFDNGKLVDVKTKVDWKTRPVLVAETIHTESGTEIALR